MIGKRLSKVDFMLKIRKTLEEYLINRYGPYDTTKELVFSFQLQNDDPNEERQVWCLRSNIHDATEPFCPRLFCLVTNLSLGYYLSKLPNLSTIKQLKDKFAVVWKDGRGKCINLTIRVPRYCAATFTFTEALDANNGMIIYRGFSFGAYTLCKTVEENGMLMNKNAPCFCDLKQGVI